MIITVKLSSKVDEQTRIEVNRSNQRGKSRQITDALFKYGGQYRETCEESQCPMSVDSLTKSRFMKEN